MLRSVRKRRCGGRASREALGVPPFKRVASFAQKKRFDVEKTISGGLRDSVVRNEIEVGRGSQHRRPATSRRSTYYFPQIYGSRRSTYYRGLHSRGACFFLQFF